MPRYEYKTVAAPRRAGKHKGLKGGDAFAQTIEELIAEHANSGWEYLRADTLACDEKRGFFSKREEILYSFLVFRREEANAVKRAGVDPVSAPVPAHKKIAADIGKAHKLGPAS